MSPTTTFWIGVGVGVTGYMFWALYRFSKVSPELMRRLQEEMNSSYRRGVESGRYGAEAPL